MLLRPSKRLRRLRKPRRRQRRGRRHCKVRLIQLRHSRIWLRRHLRKRRIRARKLRLLLLTGKSLLTLKRKRLLPRWRKLRKKQKKRRRSLRLNSRKTRRRQTKHLKSLLLHSRRLKLPLMLLTRLLRRPERSKRNSRSLSTKSSWPTERLNLNLTTETSGLLDQQESPWLISLSSLNWLPMISS